MFKEIRAYNIISTRCCIGRVVIAATYMHSNGHICWHLFQGQVIEAQVFFSLCINTYARSYLSFPIVLIRDHAPSTIIQLQEPTACIIEFTNNRLISLSNILNQLFHIRVVLTGVVTVLTAKEFRQHLRWARDSLFCFSITS